MRTKQDILQQVGEMAIESPRSGIIPDLADAIMIEVFIDLRDIFELRSCQIIDRLAALSKKD